jgi:TetR/AcrR family transcriptional regulator
LPPRGGPPRAAERTAPVEGPADVGPLYSRLPRGPHRLARAEVVRHQRARIHGAMVEAISRDGYEGTSVKQVIALAGVSRRSFYEQFPNKQACFLATFDVIAAREIRRMARAYLASEGALGERLGAAYEAVAEQASQNRKAASLVLLHAQTAGAAGTQRVRSASATCERMLARSLADAPGATSLPAPIVRGIAGGLQGVLASALRDEGPVRPGLGAEMVRWTLLFQTPGAAHMGELLAARVSRRLRELSLASARRAREPDELAGDERSRLLHHALRLAALHDYRELSAPQIADEARVPIEVFLELFASREECYIAALEEIGDRLLAIAADPDLRSGEWTTAVRRVLANLLSYLGAHPLHARTIAQEAFAAGGEAVRLTLGLADAIAALLIEGAPGEAGTAIAVAGIAGALMHTVRCQVVSGRIQLLGALSDHLSYLVLAPFIGAEGALEAVSGASLP